MTKSYSHCNCGKKFRIIDVRYYTLGNTESVYRRKVCDDCESKLSTIEIPLELATKAFGNFTAQRNRKPYQLRRQPCKTA